MEDKLLEAAESGDLEELQRILNEGVDVNCKGKDGLTPLMKATLKGHIDVANYC